MKIAGFKQTCAAAVVAALLTAIMSQASAQDRTWTGAGGNANMGNAANWVEGSPLASTDYHFIFAPANLLTPFRLNPQSNVTGLGILSLSLAGNETYAGFSIGGTTALTLKGNVSATSGTHALNAPVTVSVDTTWNIASGALVSFAGTDNITHAADRTLIKTGDGTLFFEGRQNNLAGTIRVDGGTITAQNQGAFGTAALLLNSGSTLRLQRNDPSSYNANTTVAGNVTVTSSRATTSGTGVNHALGTLAMGAHTMTVNSGDNGLLTGGTASITFGATTLSGNATFHVDNNVSGVTTSLRLGAVAGEGFGFTKTGSGNLELTAAGTFNGTVRIGAGNLILGNGSALVNATLDMNAGDAGTLGFGTLTAAQIGVLTGSRGILLENDSSAAVTLTVGSGTAPNVPSNYSGVFSGSGGITKGGAQDLTLTGNSTFTGDFLLSRGNVAVSRIGNAGEDAPLGRNGVVILGGASNNPRLAYTGAGETTDKQFQIGSGGAGAAGGGQIFNNGSGALIFNNAQFNAADTGATAAATRILTLGGNFTAGANRIDGVIADNNAINLVGVTVNGASAGVVWRLNGASSYTGPTTMSGGVLEAATLANGGAVSAIGASDNAAANLVFTAPGAILRYVGAADVTIDRGFTLGGGAAGGGTIESSGAGSLSFDTTVALAYGTADQARTLTLSGSNTGANTFGKALADNGAGFISLVKDGVGAWALTSASTYSGGTTVNSGTLLVNNTTGSGTGTGAITVKSGGTLGGTGLITGDLTVETGGILAPGASFGTLTAVNLFLDDGAKLRWELSGNATEYGNGEYDRLMLSGGLEATDKAEFDFLGSGYWSGAPTVYTLIQFSSTTSVSAGTFTIKENSLAPGLSGSISIDDEKVLLTVIPEPASLGTLGAIMLAAILRRRMRR